MAREKNGQKKHVVKKVLLSILIIFVIFFAGLGIYKLYVHMVTPSEFMIVDDNYFDYQKHYECSGYSSAYVLRSLGEDVTGLELHGSFTGKNPDGSLGPIGLRKNLNAAGYRCSILSGSLEDLKYRVSRGTPVIALIRVNTFQPYLHYVPVVGYDDEYIYVAESLKNLANAENENYNRAIEVEDFLELWKTSNSLDNVFLTIKND